jgi:thioesterase domain-containing protein
METRDAATVDAELRAVKQRIWARFEADGGVRDRRIDSDHFQATLSRVPELAASYEALKHELRMLTDAGYAARRAADARAAERRARTEARQTMARELERLAQTRELTESELAQWVGSNPRRRGERCRECGMPLASGWGFAMVVADPDEYGPGEDGDDVETVTVCRACLIDCLLHGKHRI